MNLMIKPICLKTREALTGNDFEKKTTEWIMEKNDPTEETIKYDDLIKSSLRSKTECVPAMNTMKFLIHFVSVIIFLFCGALVFAVIEDFDHFCNGSFSKNESTKENLPKSNINNTNVSLMWADIEAKHNISIDKNLKDNMLKEIADLVKGMDKDIKISETTMQKKEIVKDKLFILMKWFYFVTTSTTTIGYGLVYPTTQNGKLFYIFFSIVGIALTMSLMKSCGAILTTITNAINSQIQRKIFRKKIRISTDLMDVISMTLMFHVFMLFVVWHDGQIAVVGEWSLLDTVYFWIVSFTTVGFGDFHFSLEVEMNHVFVLLFYRLFGLSFLAGIIESIQKYLKSRKNILVKKGTQRFLRNEPSSFNNHEIYTGNVTLTRVLLRRLTNDDPAMTAGFLTPGRARSRTRSKSNRGSLTI